MQVPRGEFNGFRHMTSSLGAGTMPHRRGVVGEEVMNDCQTLRVQVVNAAAAH